MKKQYHLLNRLMFHYMNDQKVHAIWIEAIDEEGLKQQQDPLDLHIATMDNEFNEVYSDINKAIDVIGNVNERRNEDVTMRGKLIKCSFDDGTNVHIRLERMSLLAKIPRKPLKTVLDKTRNIRHVMAFEKYRQ